MRGSLDLHSSSMIPEPAISEFQTAVEGVILAFARLSLPKIIVTDAAIRFIPRKSDNTANGRYDNKSDTIHIFYPQVNYADMIFALAHEVAHRVWIRYVSTEDKQLWTHMIQAMGRRLPTDAIDFNLQRASQDKRTPLWFWYKLNRNHSLAGFRKYLETLNYLPAGFPRIYSTTSPEEAWADVTANLVLGRSHKRNLMSKAGSLPLAAAQRIIQHVAEGLGKRKLQLKRSNLLNAGRM